MLSKKIKIKIIIEKINKKIKNERYYNIPKNILLNRFIYIFF